MNYDGGARFKRPSCQPTADDRNSNDTNNINTIIIDISKTSKLFLWSIVCVIVLATRTKARNAVMLLREPGG